MKKIERIKESLIFENNFGTLYNDFVVGPNGHQGRYLRWKWKTSGVIVVPYRNGQVALAKMYRYPIGRHSLEFPRGEVSEDETISGAAIRELMEEFSLIGARPKVLGVIYPETGLLELGVPVVSLNVKGEYEGARQEIMEAVEPPEWKNIPEALKLVAKGRIFCSITIAALLLFTQKKDEVSDE